MLLSVDNLQIVNMKPINESSNKKVLIKKTHQQLDELNEDEDLKEGFKYSNINIVKIKF